MRTPSEDAELSRIIHEVAGSVSLCWEPMPKGVFESTKAVKYIEDGLKAIRTLLAKKEAPTVTFKGHGIGASATVSFPQGDEVERFGTGKMECGVCKEKDIAITNLLGQIANLKSKLSRPDVVVKVPSKLDGNNEDNFDYELGANAMHDLFTQALTKEGIKWSTEK